KEAFIQSRDRRSRRNLDIRESNRGPLGHVPSMLSPFLEEIGVALRLFDDLGDRLFVELDLHLDGWFAQGRSRIGRSKRTNLRELEKALCVRLGLTHSPWKLREACPYERDG